MLITLTALALVTLADQDGVITTAPRGAASLPAVTSAPIETASPSTTVESAASPHGLSTADQISNWIGQGRAERAASERPWAWDEDLGPRKPTGEISAGIGTGGYRDFSAAVELPVGDSGTLNLAVRQSKNDPYAYYPYGYGRGFGGWDDGWRHPPGFLSSMREREYLMMERNLRRSRDGLPLEASGSSKSVSIGADFSR